MLTTPLSKLSESTEFKDTPPVEEWEIKKLSHKHVTMCSLIAQGEGNKKVAALLQWCPEYITKLLKQTLIKEKIKEFAEAADARLVALTEQSVEVIAEVMRDGNHRDKLNAARLQLEATNRVGAGKQAGVTVNQKFVVHLPAKALSSEDWASQHGRGPLQAIDVTPIKETADAPEK